MTAETYGPRTAAWQELVECARTLGRSSIKALFAADAKRFERFSLDAEGIVLDFSRQLLDARALESLLALAEQSEVPRWIELMFGGHPVNNTEDRPALHVALRRPAKLPLFAYGEDVMPLVEGERAKMRALAEALHGGKLRGYTGKPITDLVNVGIGGSDLGIVMAVQALTLMVVYVLTTVSVQFLGFLISRLVDYEWPTLGLMTVNSLVAATHLLVPIQSSYFALEGTDDLLETYEKIRARPNPDLQFLGVVITLHDRRTVLSRDIQRQIREVFGEKVFRTMISKSVRLEESPAYKQSIFAFAPNSSGANEYYSLSEEVMGRV